MTTIPLRKIKTLARLVTTRAIDSDFKVGLESIEGWTGRLRRSESDFEGEGVQFSAGDVLYGKLRPYLAKAWTADRSGAAVGDFLVLRPGKEILSSFLTQVFLTPEVVHEVTASVVGAKMPRVNWNFVREMAVPLPPLAEQEQILAFLDRHTGEIDAFIADQEEFIMLLVERRTAVASKLFEQLVIVAPGAAAEGTTPVGALISERDERFGGGEAELLAVSIHHGVRPRSELVDSGTQAETLDNYKVVHEGDVVLNRMRAFQGALGEATMPGVASPDYAVLVPTALTSSAFLDRMFRSRPFVQAMVLRLRGIGGTDTGTIRTPRINVADLRRIRVKLPPFAEQQAIVEYVDRETAEIDATIADAREAIALSKERRAALISAAVTGKIDVRSEGAA